MLLSPLVRRIRSLSAVGSWLKGLPETLRHQHPGGWVRLVAPYGAAALLLVAVDVTGISEALDLKLYDLITTLRPAPSARRLPIAIIGISEADIGRYGWPIDDSLICRAIDRLLEGGAVAVGLDLYRDRGVGQEQACLRDLFRRDPRLVSIHNVAENIRAVPGTPPGRQGFNDLVVDADGVVRRDLVHVSGQDEATVAFPLRLVEVGFGARWLRHQLEAGHAPGPWLETTSGGYQRVDAGGYQQMLVFRQPGSFSSWDLAEVLMPGRLPSDAVRGRIVLIGSTAPTLRDVFEVPQSRFSGGASQLMVTGVELHASRVASLLDRLRGDASLRIRFLPPWLGSGMLLLALILGVVLGESFGGLRRSVVVVLCLAVGLVALDVGLLYSQRLWLELTQPLASLLLMGSAAWLRRGIASQQQRAQFEKLLGQTTSPAVARQLWNQRDGLLSNGRFEGRVLPVTVVFSDLCGFTTVSEHLAPSDLLAWLNRAMAICVPAITHRGGMVNKFTGDGFLAVFGAPVSEGSAVDAAAAVDAALAIQNSLDGLNQSLAAEGLPTMRMRVGIHSGDVLAGSMGSSERIEYALIGDTVNCASRLESLAKERHDNPCRILVSSTTHDLLHRQELQWLSWGPMHVKGREEPLEIWELRGVA
jgi:adenylate cyclase